MKLRIEIQGPLDETLRQLRQIRHKLIAFLVLGAALFALNASYDQWYNWLICGVLLSGGVADVCLLLRCLRLLRDAKRFHRGPT